MMPVPRHRRSRAATAALFTLVLGLAAPSGAYADGGTSGSGQGANSFGGNICVAPEDAGKQFGQSTSPMGGDTYYRGIDCSSLYGSAGSTPNQTPTWNGGNVCSNSSQLNNPFTAADGTKYALSSGPYYFVAVDCGGNPGTTDSGGTATSTPITVINNGGAQNPSPGPGFQLSASSSNALPPSQSSTPTMHSTTCSADISNNMPC